MWPMMPTFSSISFFEDIIKEKDIKKKKKRKKEKKQNIIISISHSKMKTTYGDKLV